MSDKDHKYSASNYLNEISIVIILLLSVFAIFKNHFVGTVGILTCIILFLFSYRAKEENKERFKIRLRI